MPTGLSMFPRCTRKALLSVNRRKKVSKVAQVSLMTQKKTNPLYVHWRALFLKIKMVSMPTIHTKKMWLFIFIIIHIPKQH